MANSRSRASRSSHRMASIVLGLCLAGLPATAHAANNCTWLNEATASGFLGGNAVGTFTAPASGQPAICAFVDQSAAATRTLRITVEVAADPHARMMDTITKECGADAAPLKAIGNEAVVCAADDRKGGLGKRVVGRVRDQVFTITIGTTLKGDPILTRDALGAKIYSAAEQVSGNLF